MRNFESLFQRHVALSPREGKAIDLISIIRGLGQVFGLKAEHQNSRQMGLNSSKARRKVTKVAPMPNREEKPPGSTAVYSFHSPLRETGPNSFALQMGRNPVLERHLPPLRETRHGRYPTEPRAGPPDLTTQQGETSIIKQHPPRRLQKLEPFILAKEVLPDKHWSVQGGVTAHNAKKELKMGGQAVTHPRGRRQYLLQMKMLEIRKEAELKRQLQEEARLNQPQMSNLNTQRTLGCLQGDSSSDEEDPFGIEDAQMFNRNHVDLWSRGQRKGHGPLESHLGQQDKVEAWLLNQQSRRESSSDASSLDSYIWKHPCQKPALVRTKTERITLFDEFFDKEL